MWGKNPPSGHKRDSKMCCVQLMASTVQFLCIIILESLLHMTMKRRAEISADIFARLLRYFSLSYKNLTISRDIKVHSLSFGKVAETPPPPPPPQS